MHLQNKVRISDYYLPLLKDVSSDVKLTSHKYCLRAGLIKQCGAGIYTWLPLGFRVLKNIQKIVTEEMNNAGLIEILMPCIQQAKIWQESSRYDDYGAEMLRIKDRHSSEMLFGPTNEELMTDVIKGTINSYKQLPKIFYHTQWKFRDEVRPRFGLMRAREFLMKDAYSFDADEKSAIESYDKMYRAYLKIFKKIGINIIPCKADAGAIGGNLNHEFHIITKSGGESKIFYDKSIPSLIEEFYLIPESSVDEIKQTAKKLQNVYAVTDEASVKQPAGVQIQESEGIEVGHIFYFGQKYSDTMKAQFLGKDRSLSNFYMGSYGIGISRLVAAIIEASHDEKGIIWPKEISPFAVGLINLHDESKRISDEIFSSIQSSILYDDSDDSAGLKFARMDLIGLPIQIIIGKNSKETHTAEIKYRSSGEKKVVNLSEIQGILN